MAVAPSVPEVASGLVASVHPELYAWKRVFVHPEASDLVASGPGMGFDLVASVQKRVVVLPGESDSGMAAGLVVTVRSEASDPEATFGLQEAPVQLLGVVFVEVVPGGREPGVASVQAEVGVPVLEEGLGGVPGLGVEAGSAMVPDSGESGPG